MENVVAALLLLQVVLMVVSLLPSTLAALQRQELRQEAQDLAQSSLEEAQSKGFDALALGPQDPQTVTRREGSFTLQLQVVQVPGYPPTSLKSLLATVQWTFQSQQFSIQREVWVSHAPQ